MIVYKILKEEEFLELENIGSIYGSQLDKTDGFIHLSTKDKLLETLEKHFCGEETLILMAIETKKIISHLKWEKSRHNHVFPHLYSDLKFNDALWFAPIQFINGQHEIPSGF